MNRQFKTNYFIIPAVALGIMYLGNCFISQGMVWYETLKQPSFILPDWVFSVAWTAIYLCATVSALLIWNKHQHERYFYRMISLFVFNALFNVMWSYVFFIQHKIGAAVLVAALIIITLIGLLYYLYPLCKRAAYLLMPYLMWMGFALYMNYQIWMLNI